jgi:hypothetical protein
MIQFEEKLLPIRDLPEKEKLESHLVCVINKNLPMLTSKMAELHIPCIENHRQLTTKLMGIISKNNGRMCRWLSGFDNSIFFQDAFMIISYFVHEDKNYINGFVKIKLNNKDTVEITYICSDLYFTGIGKMLISLVKLVIALLGIPNIMLESVNRGTTQNFYTSQGFQFLNDKGNKKVFVTNTRRLSRKDQLIIGTLYKNINKNKPILITYEPSKFELNKETMDTTELLPYHDVRMDGSPVLSPRHFDSPRPSPRSAREEDSIFRDVESPRGTARARGRKRKGTKRKKRRRH